MVKNVEVKTQGIIPRNEVQISPPRKKVFAERTTERDWREL